MEKIHSYVDLVVVQLNGLVGSIGTILVMSLLYFSVYIFSIRLIRSEIKKRKDIIGEVEHFKQNYKNNNKGKKDKATDEQMKNLLNYKYKDYPDEYFDSLRKIVDKRKPKPLIGLTVMSIQVFLFASLLSYWLMNGQIENSLIYNVIAIVVLGGTLWGKGKLWLRISFFVLVSFIYTKFNADGAMFVVFVSALRFLETQWLKNKSK